MKSRNLFITAIVLITILVFATTFGLFYLGINLGNATKSYNQATAALSTAQDSIETLNNQLATKNSDIRGLRTEKRNLQNQLAAGKRNFAAQLRKIQIKYGNSLTRVENLKRLRDIYKSYKLESEVADAKFAEQMQKYKQLLAKYKQLPSSIVSPIQQE